MKKRRRDVPPADHGRHVKPLAVMMALGCLWLAGIAPAAQADIYKYIDGEGVMHFTNTPSDPAFVLYMREKGPAIPVANYSAGPNAYDKIIRDAAMTHGVEPALIKAVIQAESDFNPRAVSRKGARGLMQIMPQNNQTLNISNAFDPKQNIMGGAMYLKRLLTRYRNQLSLALAAYNAGPTIVDQYRQIPPFSETRAYVQKVMGLYDFYKRS